MKIISFYLPQFHTFPENDEWWGKGFTEWTSVTKAEKLFKLHNQPRVPHNNNYYNLTNLETMIWQAKIAKEYGIYGFCYYHYWFDGKMLMEKPMEIMLENKAVDIPFCICWANENWTRAWAANDKEILIGQTYGNKDDWKKHFNYLLKFFKDERYIKKDGKPVFVIYRPEIIPTCIEMLTLWQQMAKENGFPGMCFIYQQKFYNHQKEDSGKFFDYGIEYQPGLAFQNILDSNLKYLPSRIINYIVDRVPYLKARKKNRITYFDYDEVWNEILRILPRDEKMIPGAFVDWDNTPRHGIRGSVVVNNTPEKFKHYLSEQVIRARDIYKKDVIFMFAWNEWGEGGYLEPDERNKYAYLEAVHEALKNAR